MGLAQLRYVFPLAPWRFSVRNPFAFLFQVKRDLTYKKPSDLNTVVEPEEQSRAYPYGRDLVPFLDVDEEAMKYHCSKELLVLGFTAAANVRSR